MRVVPFVVNTSALCLKEYATAGATTGEWIAVTVTSGGPEITAALEDTRRSQELRPSLCRRETDFC